MDCTYFVAVIYISICSSRDECVYSRIDRWKCIHWYYIHLFLYKVPVMNVYIYSSSDECIAYTIVSVMNAYVMIGLKFIIYLSSIYSRWD